MLETQRIHRERGVNFKGVRGGGGIEKSLLPVKAQGASVGPENLRLNEQWRIASGKLLSWPWSSIRD